MDPGRKEESTLLGHSIDPTVFCESPDIVPTISQMFSQGTENYLWQSITEECGYDTEFFGPNGALGHHEEKISVQKENDCEIEDEFIVPEESNVPEVMISFQPLSTGVDSMLERGFGACYVKTEVASIVSSQSEDINVVEDEATSLQDSLKESFSGKYDFSVQICERMRPNIVLFSEVWNKLYCTPFTEVDFNFCCTFNGPKEADVKLVTFLLFAENSRVMLPVCRCRRHAEKDRKNLEENGDVSADQLVMLEHIVKCKDDRSVYWKDSVTGHLGVTSPMCSWESSGGTISKTFQFDCLNTCQPHVRGRREQIVLVFEFQEGGNVVGRISLNLRVCSLPRRDHLLDNASVPDRRVSKRKLEKDSRKSSELKEATGPTVQVPDSVDIATDQTEALENLSQESGMSDMNFDGIIEPKAVMMKHMLKQAKLILSHADDERQIVRYVARNFAREIRKTVRLLGSTLEHDDFRKNDESAATP